MTRQRGFTLLEVVVSVLLLGLTAAAVVAFMGNDMDEGVRAAERMRMLGVLRRSLGEWQFNAPAQDRGQMEREGFRIRWSLVPLEESRSSGAAGVRARRVQLCALDLEVLRLRDGRRLIRRRVLVNRWTSGREARR